jgi:6-phospho-3-hexuloisomerase
VAEAAEQSLKQLGAGAIAELAGVFTKMPDDAGDELIAAIVGASRVAVYGAGREGLAIKGFAMRLHHLGLDAHVVGDMTTPPLGPGDLLIVTSGQGRLPTGEALMAIASAAGARTAVVTAEPGERAPRAADIVTVIPAQTMASDQRAEGSILPMGSLFEFAEAIFLELLVLKLRARLGETSASMRARHTNLE